MFQPNVEEIGITSNLLLTGRRSVLRRGVKPGNLSAGNIKCKLNCNCCSYHYHYLIAHKSHTDLHSLGGIEKQLQARRSSDVNLNATITCEAWGWSAFKIQDPSSSCISTSPTLLHPSLSTLRGAHQCASGLQKGIKKKKTDPGVFNSYRC